MFWKALPPLTGPPAGIIMPRWQVPAWVTTSAAQNEARTAVDMEPGNYEYMNPFGPAA